MAEHVVLDTSAILAAAGGEPGADIVREHLEEAIVGQIRIYGSFVSLTEVEYITLQEQGAEVARRILADLKALPIDWSHSDVALCSEAAELKAAHKISFADSFVAATAKRYNATLVHKDPEFQALSDIIKQQMLALKPRV